MARTRRLTPEERRERKRLRDRDYRKRNAEKIRAYRRTESYRERHREHDRKWRKANPGYMKEYLRRRREMHKTERGQMTSFVCKHCGETFQREWKGRARCNEKGAGR